MLEKYDDNLDGKISMCEVSTNIEAWYLVECVKGL